MTAYNRQEFIAEAIESVLASTFTDFELLIVDDASTDKTAEIAETFAAKDERIHVLINQKNIGQFANRNKAVTYAQGEFIMFVDSDDKIYENGIDYCLKAMLAFPKVNVGMCYKYPDKTSPFYLDGGQAIQIHFYERQFLAMGPGGTILNRNFFKSIGGYPEKYGPANDMYFNLKAVSTAGVLLIPFDYFFHRIHPGQEQNNEFAYLYANYNYTRDALDELDLGLSKKQIQYFRKKSDRRFVVNLFKYLTQTGDLKSTKKACQLAGFTWANFVKGVFH